MEERRTVTSRHFSRSDSAVNGPPRASAALRRGCLGEKAKASKSNGTSPGAFSSFFCEDSRPFAHLRGIHLRPFWAWASLRSFRRFRAVMMLRFAVVRGWFGRGEGRNGFSRDGCPCRMRRIRERGGYFGRQIFQIKIFRVDLWFLL